MEYKCPICGISQPLIERYPNYVCNKCTEEATDENGLSLTFTNEDLSGGFIAFYSKTKEKYNSHICFIRGIKCIADEARFGRIVVQVVK